MRDNNFYNSDFEYREFVVGDVTKRNNIVKNNNIVVNDPDVEHYMSLFLFDQDIINYLRDNCDDNKNHSIKGYAGKHFADEIVLDFDGNDLEKVLGEVKLFVGNILRNTFEINADAISIAFSGNKGFHISISTSLIQSFEPSINLNEIIRLFVSELTVGCYYIDMKIYNVTRIIRIINTINLKSQLYKIPLTIEEIHNLDSVAIKLLATSPREINRNSAKIEPNKKLTDLYNACRNIIQNREKNEGCLEIQGVNSHNIKSQLVDVISFLQGKINNYEEWMKLGLALASLVVKNELSVEEGKHLFVKLSINNPKYPNDDRNLIESELEKFIRYYDTKLITPVAIGTLFHIAKTYGYSFQYTDTTSTEIKLSSHASKEIHFDADKLNESTFKNMLFHYDALSSSPIEYLLTSLLTALAGTIGKKAYFKIMEQFHIYLNIWAVLIGPSTIMRKTSSINLATLDLEEITKEANSTQVSWTGLDPDYLIKIQKNKHLILPQDSTVESLSDILNSTDNGLIKHSEFGSFLAQLNRGYSGDAKQFLTGIYDVPQSYKISRVASGQKLLIRPCLSILGASTIDWIKDNSNFSDISSGFFARFLYSIRNENDKPFIPLFELGQRESFRTNFNTREIFLRLATISDDVIIDIEQDAKELFTQLEIQTQSHYNKSSASPELSFESRLVYSTLKIAGIIALTNNRSFVNFKDMNDAILIHSYYHQNIKLLLTSELTQTSFNRKERRVLTLIRNSEARIARSELLQNTGYRASELDEVINNLREKDLIIEIEEKSQGTKKPSRFYSINLISEQKQLETR